ncbi:MAG: UTP--glucose-1-phosphate uridylyltransferase GalU [Gammaproteobacteria bacterium]|nr:UTP--glucose-1-phosphate uridylyltransferase GalU [Gammaproteobacteria bacterium]
MKAIIPVAGLGTRMLPATKAIPKEMLPIVDKPMIQYIVNEIAAAGIKDIVLVTHGSKNSIENHFDTQFELESTLETRVKRQLLDEVRSITPAGVKIMHIRQGKALGLGHAVLSAKPVIGDDDFVVVLPDVLIDNLASNPAQDNLAAMVQRFEETKACQIMVNPVPDQQVSSFGVVDVNGSALGKGDFARIQALVEKPALEHAPSNLAITGRYVLHRDVWQQLASTAPGVGGEVQLTDAIAGYLSAGGELEAYHIADKTFDCGNKLGLAMAYVEHALRHEGIGDEFADFLRGLKV